MNAVWEWLQAGRRRATASSYARPRPRRAGEQLCSTTAAVQVHALNVLSCAEDFVHAPGTRRATYVVPALHPHVLWATIHRDVSADTYKSPPTCGCSGHRRLRTIAPPLPRRPADDLAALLQRELHRRCAPGGRRAACALPGRAAAGRGVLTGRAHSDEVPGRGGPGALAVERGCAPRSLQGLPNLTCGWCSAAAVWQVRGPCAAECAVRHRAQRLWMRAHRRHRLF